MRRRRRSFRGGVITLQNGLVRPFLLLAVGFVLVYLIKNIPALQLSSSFLLNSITHSIAAFPSPTQSAFAYSAYDLLADSVLSIKASETMSKKYAAKYGGVIKTEKKASSSSQLNALEGNVLEADASSYDLTFINTPGFDVNADTLLHAPLSFSGSNDVPRVLIIHTHTSEAYADSTGARSEDTSQNVVSVGLEIAFALEKAGIKTIHDTTQNDNPSYNQSYKKALTVIEKNLAANPSIEVVLDIHRDYIKRDDGSLLKPTVTTKNGKKAAQIMFVIGTDHMGLYHPDWRHNLSFAVKIQDRLNRVQPGLCRSINLRTERFNQHATLGSMIIEVGTGVNTVAEAKLSGKYIGEAIATVLKEY